jgi:hypothetical protein
MVKYLFDYESPPNYFDAILIPQVHNEEEDLRKKVLSETPLNPSG